METTLKAKILTGKKGFSARLDEAGNFLIIEATERPDKGKANKEIVKELKKKFKAETMIVSGLKSREKIIRIELPREQVLRILEAQTNSAKPLKGAHQGKSKTKVLLKG